MKPIGVVVLYRTKVKPRKINTQKIRFPLHLYPLINNLLFKKHYSLASFPSTLHVIRQIGRVDPELLTQVEEYEVVPSESASYSKAAFWDERYSRDEEVRPDSVITQAWKLLPRKWSNDVYVYLKVDASISRGLVII